MSDPRLAEWLESIGLGHHTQLFANHDVDLATLLALSEDDLEQLGLPVGARKRLRAAAAVREGDTSSEPAGERRQLAVLFSDLVGFTELAGRLDPEELHDMIRRYEDVCAGSVAR
ncbi:MAG TPA: hypothetical protein VGP56_06795, partial [Gaiellaceae bacterium]|nr:hypothetical protein [Gaiellaceae bacterium]